MARKDYYKILGVEKTASDDEIKKAYRKLAMKWHPDKHTNDSEADKKKAEEMFKDIAEAYEVLSNPTEREKYDNPQSDFTFGGFSGGNPFDMFSGFGNPFADIFSMFGGQQPQEDNTVGSTLKVSLQVSLEDIYNGTLKKIRFKRNEFCEECNGSGLGKNGSIRSCPTCGGTGFINNLGRGIRTMYSCDKCHGTGKIIQNPCKKCNGVGLFLATKEIEIEIPKGVANGARLVYENEGSQSKVKGGKSGDLFVFIQQKEHPVFERDANNLYCEISVPVITAMVGGNVNIQTIDGKTLSVKIPQGCNNDQKMRLVGKGMPIYNTNDKYGDLYGIVNIKLPTKITDEEKKVLEGLKDHPNFQ